MEAAHEGTLNAPDGSPRRRESTVGHHESADSTSRSNSERACGAIRLCQRGRRGSAGKHYTKRTAMDPKSDSTRSAQSDSTGNAAKPDQFPRPTDDDGRDTHPTDEVEIPIAAGGEPAHTGEAVQPWNKVQQRIRSLQLERAELKAKAKAAAKAMRAAQRAKRRTARNAKKLSDEELVQIVMERKVQAEVAKQVAAEAASAAARASGSASAPPPKTARKQKASGHEK